MLYEFLASYPMPCMEIPPRTPYIPQVRWAEKVEFCSALSRDSRPCDPQLLLSFGSSALTVVFVSFLGTFLM